MSDGVLVAIISFLATLISGFSGFRLIAYRVEQLENGMNELKKDIKDLERGTCLGYQNKANFP